MSEQKQEQPPKGNARIPVRKIWFHEPVDLPGGQASILDCSPQPPGRQFYVAHFVPAHQVIELEHWRNEKAEPYRTRLGMRNVDRMD
jgi:hypothetical protein